MHIDWHDLIFVLPILFSLALGAGSLSGIFGGLDADADLDIDLDVDIEVDADVDVDADAETDAETESSGGVRAGTTAVLEFLGVGKAPLSILLSTVLMVFGVTGLVMVRFVSPSIALLVAMIIAPMVTAILARTLGRFMPTAESYVARRGDLVGRMGVARVRIDGEFGAARVYDDRGELHDVSCRAPEPIAVGESVVVVDWDAERRVFEVASLEASE